jgi:hypothetical protein
LVLIFFRLSYLSLSFRASEWSNFLSPSPSTSLFASSALRAASASCAWAPSGSEDAHLGWVELESGSFLVRPRSPFKSGLDLVAVKTTQRWIELAEGVAKTTAANHARADDDYDRRLVPTSFEEGFARLVPADMKNEWSTALAAYAWEQLERRGQDYGCWLNHHAESQTTEAPAAIEEEEEEEDEAE